MREATEKTVLGDFNNVVLSANGVSTTFSKNDGKFWVRTDGPDGKMADFEIRYAFGIYPLQQYLIALPRGHWQVLGAAWDSRSKAEGGQRWYSMNPERKLTAGDPLHWTGVDQNWNYQCAWCHSTDVQKNYDPASDSFHTTWSEISVGCEACHGPASNHIAWATKSNGSDSYSKDHGLLRTFDERNGASWLMQGGQAHRSNPRTTNKEIEICAQCHSRRQQFSSNPASMEHLTDAFRPTTLEPGPYYPDGQQHEEVYTYASFAQSRMFAAGVTCSDCHNPHTGKLRFQGNSVCAQCHAPDRFDTPNHHHHRVDTPGAKCVSCHMPTTTYMGVDQRHDHSMRIPRPDRTIALGTPNACTKCHEDKTAAWASGAIHTWFPNPKPGMQDFAEAFASGDRGAPGAQAALREVASNPSSSPIAKASALARLARYPSASTFDLAARLLDSDEPLIRATAVSVIANADSRRRQALLVRHLTDASKLVRMDAARALADLPDGAITGKDKENFDKALTEYTGAQLFNAERPEALTDLGAFYRDRAKPDQARQAFEKAIAIDPSFAAAGISLADIMREQGDEAGAEQILRKSLEASPKSAAVEYALGLSLIRQKRTAEGMASLAAAAAHSPDDPHLSYALAVAMHDSGRPADAIQALKSALAHHPYDREILWGLASYEAEAGNIQSAIDRLSLLGTLEPEESSIMGALATLKGAPNPQTAK